jgi:tol-pal system protein YbgF
VKVRHSYSRSVLWVSVILACVLFTACVPNPEQEQSLKQLQSQISVLSNEVRDSFEKSENERIELYEKLNDDVSVLHRNQADAATGDEELQSTLAAIDAKLDEYNDRMAKLSEHLEETEATLTERMTMLSEQVNEIRRGSPIRSERPESSPTPVPTPEPSSEAAPSQQPSLPPEASQVYHKAYTAYVNGDFQKAIDGFRTYIDQYPDTAVAHIAQFWIAESYFSMGDYETALRDYDTLINDYPNSDKIPAAFFSKADAYLKLGRQMEAISHLKYIVNRFPDSNAAQKAAERLRALGE